MVKVRHGGRSSTTASGPGSAGPSSRPQRSSRSAPRAVTLAIAALLAGAGTTAVTATPTAAARPAVTTTSAVAATPVDNPYLGATVYVNPDWSARAAAEPGGARISGQPTAVWLDSVASIEAPAGSGYATSLRGHLDNALAQRATLVQFVIHNLPGRDCLTAPDGTGPDPEALERYRREYIDRIAAVQADPKYSSLRIVNLIEVGSLASAIMTANTPVTPACAAANAGNYYQTGIAYALGALDAAGPHTYQYLDASHHGRVGWDYLLDAAARLLAQTARSAIGGLATVDGFVTNAADYSTLREPYFSVDTLVAGQPVRQSRWVDWNSHIEELSFTAALRAQLIALGFSPGIGMLVDTSRNGWGGPARPTGPSTSSVIDTFVEQSRVDRRFTTDNWCNQAGAGLGERPRAAPGAGIDAYVWAKPPGVSDGSPVAVAPGPANPAGKPADPMCAPYLDRGMSTVYRTGALPDAPAFGTWFSTHFQQLTANAYPPLETCTPKPRRPHRPDRPHRLHRPGCPRALS